MTEPAQPSRIGEVVGGKYRIVRFLATGGMGVVYEAQHEVVKRRFAVKMLRVGLSERRDILTRFQREAEAAGALESENVAAAIDFGIAPDGTPYIVMEYLVGESLAALLGREGPLPLERAADLVIQASRGMQVAHGAGIVHRDLKPQNLFVCRREDGTDLVKVLDFGVAKLQAFDELNAATRTGTVMGTAAYMAPEQARGDKIVDLRADVYALGAILYELLSGQLPHPGDSHNAILHHISTQPAVPLDSVRPELPRDLTGLVGRALASNPGDRPASAEAFGQALAPFAARRVWPVPRLADGTLVNGERSSRTPGTPAQAATPGDATAPTASVGARSATPATAPDHHEQGRPRRLVLAVAALVVAVILAAAGVRAFRARPEGEAHAPPRVAAEPAPPPAPVVATPPPAPVVAAPAPAESTAPAPSSPAATGEAPATARRPRRPGTSAPRRPETPAKTTTQAAPGAPGSNAARPRIAPVTFDEQNPYN